MSERGMRRRFEGVVKGNRMEKTVIVEISRRQRHPQYEKVVTLRTKVYAHHEGEQLEVGASVLVEECRPMSKLKRWRVVTAG